MVQLKVLLLMKTVERIYGMRTLRQWGGCGIINSGKAKDPLLAHQLWVLFYLCAFFEFDILAVHAPGQRNRGADAISCNNIEVFHSQVLYASREPSVVSVEVQLGLSIVGSCWRSPEWKIWFADSLAPSTVRAYTLAQERYAEFCLPPNYIPLLPLNENRLCRFSVWMAAQSISVRTIKSYLSGLRYLQMQRMGHDLQMSSMVTLHYMLQGVKRSQALAGVNVPWMKLPITMNIMQLLKQSWQARGVNFTTVMLWVVECICSLGFCDQGRRHQHRSRCPPINKRYQLKRLQLKWMHPPLFYFPLLF